MWGFLWGITRETDCLVSLKFAVLRKVTHHVWGNQKVGVKHVRHFTITAYIDFRKCSYVNVDQEGNFWLLDVKCIFHLHVIQAFFSPLAAGRLVQVVAWINKPGELRENFASKSWRLSSKFSWSRKTGDVALSSSAACCVGCGSKQSRVSATLKKNKKRSKNVPSLPFYNMLCTWWSMGTVFWV